MRGLSLLGLLACLSISGVAPTSNMRVHPVRSRVDPAPRRATPAAPSREEDAGVEGGGARRLPAAPGGMRNPSRHPVMHGAVRVHVVWYGNWSLPQRAILSDLLDSIGGTPWLDVVKTYPDAAGPASTNVSLGESTFDAAFSRGTSLSDSDVWLLINSALQSGRLPASSLDMYAVLTSPTVAATSGFCTSYCGYHDRRYFIPAQGSAIPI